MNRTPFALVLVFLCLLSNGCQRAASTLPTSKMDPDPLPVADAKVQAAGLHNVYRLTDKLYSGSSPEGEEGFRSLEKLGVRTIVSVDGARPDVETAHKFGMRYVHLPIGYDGLSQEQAFQLAKAARDLPGPVYFHCHHGQHRGPAAAAVVHLALDETCTVETALAEMRRAGTDPHYTGLYAAPAALRRPHGHDLDALPANFPEVTPLQGLVPFMVGLDEHLERLKQIRAAGWQAPPEQPDLDPPHEALQLLEQYREARRLPEVAERPEAFRRLLTDAEETAQDLEAALRRGNENGLFDNATAEKRFARVAAACVQCHAKYRDVPK